MSIREKGYHNWNGTLVASPHKWLPIVRFSIRQIYQKRFAKALFAVNLIPLLIFLFFSYILYIANRPDMAFVSFLKEIPSDITTLDFFFYTFYCFGPIVFFRYIILSLFCGADLISADLRSNAFPLYFSKPIRAVDYLVGKFLSILLFLLLFSLFPALILLFVKIAFSGFHDIGWRLLVGVFFYPFLISSAMSLFVLWISSLSQNSRWVKSLFFVFLFGLSAVGGILTGISGGDRRFMLIDLNTNIVQSGHFFFNVKSDFTAAPWISALILLILSCLLFFLIIRKIKRTEV